MILILHLPKRKIICEIVFFIAGNEFKRQGVNNVERVEL